MIMNGNIPNNMGDMKKNMEAVINLIIFMPT
jgi:hypothetical protein